MTPVLNALKLLINMLFNMVQKIKSHKLHDFFKIISIYTKNTLT